MYGATSTRACNNDILTAAAPQGVVNIVAVLEEEVRVVDSLASANKNAPCKARMVGGPCCMHHSQLHDDVAQATHVAASSLSCFGCNASEPLDLAIDDALPGRELAVDDALGLLRELGEDLRLDAAQQKRAENLVQARDDDHALLLTEL
jgi:hypothetical protein